MADYLIDKLEMENNSKLFNPKLKKNVEILTPDDLKQNIVYHIALDKRNKLFPNISKRAGATEDNTLPRVHVAPHFFWLLFWLCLCWRFSN